MSEAKTLRRKAVSNIVPRDVFREVQLETMQRVSEALANSFGPAGSTTLIRTGMDEKDTGVSAYTKDGHRILSSIKFSKPIEMSILDDLKDITRNTVKTVGDGTTSAVMLSAAIFEAMNTLSDGKKDKYYAECLKDIVKAACEVIAQSGRECTLEDIYQIAYISTDGNKEVSQNISDLYKKFGMNVFIDVGISNTPETTLKTYDGLTIQAGYFDPCFINVEGDSLCTLKNANIYIFEDAINTPEMLNFCYKIIEDNILTPFQKYDEYLKKKDMKKATKVYIIDGMLAVLLIIWLLVTLASFQLVHIDFLSGLTSNVMSLTGNKYIGAIFIYAGIGFSIFYTLLVVLLYYWRLNKNLLFWMNVLSYSLQLSAVLIGVMMIVINF